MEITNVRVRLAGRQNERLCGYCTITFDEQFVVRDLRIIAGEKGYFVAMPSRKSQWRCPRCGHKNSYQARFCNDCGNRLGMPPSSEADPSRMHVDIAHPITPECRRLIQDRVIEAFEHEHERARHAGHDDTTPVEDFDNEDYEHIA